METTVKKILFVCTGNTCRSPMTEGMLKKAAEEKGLSDRISVSSAGISVFRAPSASPEAVEVMRRAGIDISSHRPRQVTAEMLLEADLVITMTESHRSRILDMYPEIKGKVYTIKKFAKMENGSPDIPDPFGGAEKEYKRIASEIGEAVKKIIDRLSEG